jgi:hypothetical protein
MDIVRKERLCFNCLGNHRASDCSAKENITRYCARLYTSNSKETHKNEDRVDPKPNKAHAKSVSADSQPDVSLAMPSKSWAVPP